MLMGVLVNLYAYSIFRGVEHGVVRELRVHGL